MLCVEAELGQTRQVGRRFSYHHVPANGKSMRSSIDKQIYFLRSYTQEML